MSKFPSTPETTGIYDVKNWASPDFVSALFKENASTVAALFGGNVPDKIESVEVESLSGAGGNSGEMNRLIVNKNYFAVLKTTKAPGQSAGMSKSLGLYREAMFYSDANFMSRFEKVSAKSLPKVYLSKFDLESGRKCILLEDLCKSQEGAQCAVQTGYFFGDNSILNKGKDLADLTKDYAGMENVKEVDMTLKAFRIAAQLHGTFWGDEELRAAEYNFLKGQLWFKGEGQESWAGSVGYAKQCWEDAKGSKLAGDKPSLNFSDEVIKYLDDSFSITFEEYTKEVQHIPFTLVHGDFHPANFMTVKDSAAADGLGLKVLDFEVLGLGSGPQDLGQFMISHSAPAVRRENEAVVLQAYQEELEKVLKGRGVDAIPTMDDIKHEYVVGGLGRWVWLLAVICSMCPPPMTQYFHDQIAAFLKDHADIHKGVKIAPRP